MSSLLSAANRKIQKKSRKMAADNTSITKEEVTTPTNESKEAGLVPLIPQADEQKQVTLYSVIRSFSTIFFLRTVTFIVICYRINNLNGYK